MPNLKKEFEFFLKNHDNLLKEYQGQYIVIKDEKVIGAFASEAQAIEETVKQHPLGSFLVQKCEPGENSYRQTYSSRIVLIQK
ncbi:MAG: DUF5678 domain-containing protein [Candidatus Krumholzibacteriaceae bacterium]